MYSIVSNEWTALGDFPSSARRGGLSFTGSNGLYYTTGVTVALERTAETWRYEPLVNLNELSGIHFSVYPNPVSNVLTIESGGTIETITILSLDGKILMETEGTETVDLSEFGEGYYIMKVLFSDGTIHTVKIAKE